MIMAGHWTFGQRMGAGFAVAVALAAAIGIVGIYALKSVVESKDRVILVNSQRLIESERLRSSMLRKSVAARGYMLTGEKRFFDDVRKAREDFLGAVARLRGSGLTEEGQRLIRSAEQAEVEHYEASERVIALRATDADIARVADAFEKDVMPKRDRVERAIAAFVGGEERSLEEARAASSATASGATSLLIGISAGLVLVAILIAFALAKSLSQQIGGTVGQMQSSSAELSAAANQQATGAKEQTTAMSEISTTIKELLATSRQIAESAQRVAQIAEQTLEGARTGNATVDKAHGSIGGIRRQVDQVVSHMLELGKKSQQIGAVLDIVSELAEQTNILAINATIEAAGAGDGGKRFAVVADEIRKLSDRVTNSTKEIRALIDDVRSAVNTTVMATETGSKAVDAGGRQFGEVAAAFKQIADLVNTTSEAAREIELSTKQQATAVEQVNLAITNAAQATRETEASSGQTLQTASQLATLSKDLLRLVQPQAAA
jgi:methyl-accepting chemotaxis protein